VKWCWKIYLQLSECETAKFIGHFFKKNIFLFVIGTVLLQEFLSWETLRLKKTLFQNSSCPLVSRWRRSSRGIDFTKLDFGRKAYGQICTLELWKKISSKKLFWTKFLLRAKATKANIYKIIFLYLFIKLYFSSWRCGMASTCHRGDWRYGSWDRILATVYVGLQLYKKKRKSK
jgi:hypothetical protein